MEIDLARAVSLAADVLRSDQDGDLPLGYRQLIWSKMGPKLKKGGPATIGYTRRVTLAIATVRKVLPLWEHIAPDDPLPNQALEAAARVSRGNASERTQAWAVYRDLFRNTDSLFALYGYGQGVALAATFALRTAIKDEDFDLRRIDLALTDKMKSGEEKDCTYCAAMAYADGRPGVEGASVEKRREFWTWWLEEAVPFAWTSAPSHYLDARELFHG